MLASDPSQLGYRQLLWLVYQCEFQGKYIPGYKKEIHRVELEKRGCPWVVKNLETLCDLDKEYVTAYTEYDSISREVFIGQCITMGRVNSLDLQYSSSLRSLLDRTEWKEVMSPGGGQWEDTCFVQGCTEEEEGDVCPNCDTNYFCFNHCVFVLRDLAVCRVCYEKKFRVKIPKLAQTTATPEPESGKAAPKPDSDTKQELRVGFLQDETNEMATNMCRKLGEYVYSVLEKDPRKQDALRTECAEAFDQMVKSQKRQSDLLSEITKELIRAVEDKVPDRSCLEQELKERIMPRLEKYKDEELLSEAERVISMSL